MSKNQSYDYEDLIYEIESEIEEGLLVQDADRLLVLRQDEAINEDGYRPIIDYYHTDFEQSILEEQQEYKQEHKRLAAIGVRDVELEREHKSDNMLFKRFLEVKNKLVDMSVNEVLVEMYDWNRILR